MASAVEIAAASSAPVSLAPSSTIVQLTAAAGHALAILAVGGNLTAATEPLT
jgi:hypothetical protein